MILGCLFWGAVVGSGVTYWLMSAQLEAARQQRFSLLHATQGWVYRIENSTGRTWYMVAGQDWKEVEDPTRSNVIRFDANGKRIH